MKRFFILTGALALAIANSQGQLVIEELNEGIVATYNGSLISPAVNGPTDGWTIQLPAGFTISPTYVGSFYQLGEPENANEHNDVAITQPNFLTWNSDLQGPGSSPPFPATSITLPGAGTYTDPAGTIFTFDVTLADEESSRVPETPSTAALLGTAVAGLLLAERRCRAALRRC